MKIPSPLCLWTFGAPLAGANASIGLAMQITFLGSLEAKLTRGETRDRRLIHAKRTSDYNIAIPQYFKRSRKCKFICYAIMSGEKQSDDKRANKHIGRPPGAHRHVSHTRPRAVTYSRFHRRYAAKHLRCHHVHLGGARPPYNVLHLRTFHGGRALHIAYIAPAMQVV